MPTIAALETADIRFPTSRALDGSDAMNPDPDYSAAYVVLKTDAGDGLEGHGFAFTVGRGTEVQVAAIDALAPLVVGLDLDGVLADMAGFWRRLVADSQLRWLGPEKGVIHMATAAVVNAVWDLYAKREGKPLWRLLAEMTPAEQVALVDFRYVSDALSREEALELLESRAAREDRAHGHAARRGHPGVHDVAGMARVLRREDPAPDPRGAGGRVRGTSSSRSARDVEDDIRRCGIAREEMGPELPLLVDANQAWDVETAIAWMRRLEPFGITWIEEPTSPDDVLGHAAIARAVHADRGRDGRALPQPRDVQAAHAGGGDRLLPDRRLPARRRQRGRRRAAAGGEVRRPGLPARRRRRAVRARAAPRRVRLRRGRGKLGEPRSSSSSTTCTSTSSIRASSRAAAIARPPRPGTARRCGRESRAEHAFPHGSVWAAEAAAR